MALKKLIPLGNKKQIGDGSVGSEEDKLRKENKELKEKLYNYQLTELVSDQPRFNLWVMEEMKKLKDGINQMGELLSENQSSEESETEQEEVEEESEN